MIKYLIFSFFIAIASASLCPKNWYHLTSSKCIHYFDNRLNFSEAESACREIYDGTLVTIESEEEQRSLVQYLFEIFGYKRGPISWIGAKVEPPSVVKLLDGSIAKYSNFDSPSSSITNSDTKCVKILSLLSKGEKGVHGAWTLDGCKYNDAGFICQKQVSLARTVDYIQSDSPKMDMDKPAASNFLLDQFKEQLITIKDVCESQMKAIEKLSNNFLYVIQQYNHQKNN